MVEFNRWSRNSSVSCWFYFWILFLCVSLLDLWLDDSVFYLFEYNWLMKLGFGVIRESLCCRICDWKGTWFIWVCSWGWFHLWVILIEYERNENYGGSMVLMNHLDRIMIMERTLQPMKHGYSLLGKVSVPVRLRYLYGTYRHHTFFFKLVLRRVHIGYILGMLTQFSSSNGIV